MLPLTHKHKFSYTCLKFKVDLVYKYMNTKSYFPYQLMIARNLWHEYVLIGS